MLSDLRENKLTSLMYCARRSSTGAELTRLLGSKTITEADAEHIRYLVEASGARRYVETLIDDHTRLAHALIDSLPIRSGLRVRLHDVVQQASERVA